MKQIRSSGSASIWALGIVLALVLAVGVGLALTRGRNEALIGNPGTPIVLMLSKEHGEKLSAQQRKDLATYIEAETDLVTEVRVASSALEGIEAFREDADVGLLNLFEYLLARKEFDVEASLQALRKDGLAAYRGEVIVLAGSPAQAIGDLASKQVGYVDRFSTSGFVFPAKLFADASISVVPVFTGSHVESLKRLRDGSVDAAATYAGAAAGADDVRSIARSEAIPNEPVFFRKKFAVEKRERVAAALMKLGTIPEGKMILGDVADITGFREADDGEYDRVLAAIRAAGTTLYAVVPQGHQVESERRGIDFIP